VILRKLTRRSGEDPVTALSSLLNDLESLQGKAVIITGEALNDPSPALIGKGVSHFFVLDDPVKGVELASLLDNPVLAVIGSVYSGLFLGGLDRLSTVLMEKLFLGSSPEYLELLEDAFPSMLAESLSGLGITPDTVGCVAASIPSQRLVRRLPRYLKGIRPDALRYVEESRKAGLGPVDSAAYTLGKCLEGGPGKSLFVGLSEWGLLTGYLG